MLTTQVTGGSAPVNTLPNSALFSNPAIGNEIQTLAFTGTPPTTFTLTFQAATPNSVAIKTASITFGSGGATLAASMQTELEKVVVKLLAKRQEDRYQTPAEVLADLEPIAEKEGVEL